MLFNLEDSHTDVETARMISENKRKTLAVNAAVMGGTLLQLTHDKDFLYTTACLAAGPSTVLREPALLAPGQSNVRRRR